MGHRAVAAPIVLCAAIALSACGGTGGQNLPGGDSNQPFAGIGHDELLHFLGTEPFWGGEVSGQTLTYSTPENQDGDKIPVERFDGRGGLSFTGTLHDADFVLMVSDYPCSDNMSDRTYPFTVTLRVNNEIREGCAWTDHQPATGPAAP